jgi:hypothetical protein
MGTEIWKALWMDGQGASCLGTCTGLSWPRATPDSQSGRLLRLPPTTTELPIESLLHAHIRHRTSAACMTPSEIYTHTHRGYRKVWAKNRTLSQELSWAPSASEAP